MRDQPAATALDILVDIARGFDGQDRSYLEALGTGATGKEPALYERLRRELGVKDDPLTWSAPFARIAWRLHVPAAVPDLTARATIAEAVARRSPARARHARLHQGSGRVEGDARACGAGEQPVREPATWWLLNRMSNDWADSRAAAGAQDGRHLRSRDDHAARDRRTAAAGGSCRSSRSTRSSASPATRHAGRTRPRAA